MKDFLIQTVYAQSPASNGVATKSTLTLSGSGKGVSFDRLFTNINDQIITPIIYLLFAAATVYFLYGVFVYIQNAESPEKRIEGQKSMIWGIVGLFIMLSVKGIINLVLRTIGAI